MEENIKEEIATKTEEEIVTGSERIILPRGLPDYQGRQELQGYEVRFH